MTETINDEATVVAWFSNHQFPLAKLREMAKTTLGKACELVKAGATRFGTHTLVGERLMQLKPALQATVVDAEYVAQNYKDKANTEEMTGSGKTVRSNKGATTKKHILDDDGTTSFWARVRNHVNATMPLFKMLRRFDSSAPAIGKVYSSWFESGEHLKSIDAPYKQACVEKHLDRWTYGHSDFAAAAYMLDPEFFDHDQSKNNEVCEGFDNIVEKIGILRKVRAEMGAATYYKDMWAARLAAIGNDPSKLSSYDSYPAYPDAKDADVKAFAKTVSAQLNMYRNKKGTFSRDWVMELAHDMPAYLWWDEKGSSVPELQYVACLVLSHPASASIIERINSEFAFVKDARRNKLSHTKADKLVALFHNLRLLHKVKKPMYTEPAIGWNEDDFQAGVTKYGVAHYEGAKKHAKAPTRPRLLPLEPCPEVVIDVLEGDGCPPLQLM